MFTKIELGNFKLYQEHTVFGGLKKINVLTGINGRGKSTFLQSLLLFKQTLLQNNRSTSVVLNGEYIHLGNAFDVKNVNVSRSEPVTLDFFITGYSLHYRLNAEENGQSLIVDACFIADEEHRVLKPEYEKGKEEDSMLNLLPASMEEIVDFNRIQYVSAERIGPQLHYAIYDNAGTVGAKGEYAVCQLHLHKGDALPDNYFEELENMFYEVEADEADHTIGGQVEFWLTQMFSRTTIDTVYVEEANVATLKISTNQNGTNRMKPTNVGFGYTYVLPILVAGLTAKSGDTLIVENPEAHLHPAAQSMIGRFLALVAQMGVQVFVETHSEHILNAFRVLIAQRTLDKEDLNVMFFADREEGYYTPIEVDEQGKIMNWPSYFFDQAERDLNIILGE